MKESKNEDEVVRLLRQNNELLALIAKSTISDVLDRELADPKNRKLYQLTGHGEAVQAIAKKVGMGAATISRLWQRWEQFGLLVKDGKRYRRTLG